jgi:thioesterase domain-containing protein
MARALHTQGHQVGALVLIDALHLAEAEETRHEDEISLWIDMAADLAGTASIDRNAWREALLPLDHDQRTAYVAADLGRQGYLPPGLGTMQLERMLGVYVATSKAVRSYAPQPYPGAGILVRATETAAKYSGSFVDGAFGWQPLFAGGLEIRDVPGDHYSILSAERVASLASILAGLRSADGTSE